MVINGQTKLLGVIGWPIKHSRSPQMQNAALQAAGLDYVYVPMPVEPSRVGEAVRGLRGLGFRGVNVTIPHKLAVMEHLDEIAPAARGIGAVNTIIVEDDGRLVGDNTDCFGAVEPLESEFGVKFNGEHVVILGAGGAARAAAWGSAHSGARTITICNRTVSKAENLAADMRGEHPKTEFRAAGSPSAEDIADAAIFLQMTSLGMNSGDPLPLDPKIMPQNAVGLDAVYSPLETPWIRECRAKGLQIADGLTMLVAQGVYSFEKWTGVRPDKDVMRRALHS